MVRSWLYVGGMLLLFEYGIVAQTFTFGFLAVLADGVGLVALNDRKTVSIR